MPVKLYLVGEKVEVVVDPVASVSVVEKSLAHKLGYLKRVGKIKVRLGDASILRRNFVIHTSFKEMDSL